MGSPKFRRRVQLWALVDEDLDAEIRDLAYQNDRSISSTVSIILRKGLGQENLPLFKMLENDE